MTFSMRRIALPLGPLIFAALWANPGFPFEGQVQSTLGVALWMALWWISECVALEATSLLPILLFPMLGILDAKQVALSYGDPMMYLFLGGFVLAQSMENWNLHKRMALNIVLRLGADRKRLILGFMIAVAFLSMWMSNTATAAMMLPIGISLLRQSGSEPRSPYATALILSIAYAASIGGMATIIGTPPNMVLAAVFEQEYGQTLTFGRWFSLGFPVSVILLFATWWVLTRRLEAESEVDTQRLKNELSQLGPFSAAEKKVALVFALTALAWMTRPVLLKPWLPAISDSHIALLGAFCMFLLPGEKGGRRLFEWSEAHRLPWGTLLLFGGGLALAAAFESSGLAGSLASGFTALAGWPNWLVLLLVVAAINFLTEITSNLATTAVALPLLHPLAQACGMPPLALLGAATLAASCAFMLPVATAANTFAYGTGFVAQKDMIRTGLRLNFISIVVISLLLWWLGV
ncbi:MAG: SLC13 family permease [Bacteroidia bacterium]